MSEDQVNRVKQALGELIGESDHDLDAAARAAIAAMGHRTSPLTRHLRMIANDLEESHAAESVNAAAEILEQRAIAAMGGPASSAEQIDAAARYLARTVNRIAWDGIRKDGRAGDAGFDPWIGDNARQEDYRDVVREIVRLAAMDDMRVERPAPLPDDPALRAVADDWYTWGFQAGMDAAKKALGENWRPIESAPKNRIIDLLFRGALRMTDCIWYHDEWWSTEQGDPSICLGTKATHWMPPPAPPVTP